MNPILWMALLQPAWAASLSVSQDGSGDHTDIQAAINASNSGDEIVVHSGEWSVNLDFQNKSLALIGDGSPILRAEEEMFPVVTLSSTANNQSRIEGFQFDGANGVALLILDAEVVLADLTITGFGDFQGAALVQSGGHVVGESLALSGGVGLQGGLIYVHNGVLEL